MSVLGYERRASVQLKSSMEVLLLFNQELPLSDFTFLFLLSYTETEKNTKSNKTKPDKTEKIQEKPNKKTPKPKKVKALQSPYPEG